MSGVYILQSQKNGSYYVGSTENIERRLREHNYGMVRYTQKIRPLVLKVFIKCLNITEAKQAEYRLKRYKRKDVLDKIIIDGLFPWNYSKNGID